MIPDEEPDTAQSQSVCASSPIDMEVLNQLRNELAQISPDLLNEFITAYLLNAPQMVASIRKAASERNGELLNRMAHTLKANSARLGAMSCSKLCQVLELMGEQGSFAEAIDNVVLLEAEYKRVEERLRQEIDSDTRQDIA